MILTRFHHIVCTTALVAGSCIMPIISAGAEEPSREGEPYALLGNRIVFTNWMYVRPGDVGWVDAEGKSVYADKERKLGPFDAQWHPQDHLPWGIRIKAQKPEVRQWRIEPEYPWEQGGVISISSVVRDGGIFKVWGGCKAGSCYLESKDGLIWKRPKLGLVEFEGSTDNNLIPSGPAGVVFIDPTSRDERYKCVYAGGGDMTLEEFEAFKKRHPDKWGPQVLRSIEGEPHIIYLRGAVSSDGFHWEELPDPILMEHCDTENIGYYDPRLKKYVAYVRTWNALKRDPNLPSDDLVWDTWFPSSRRSIARAISDDFRLFPRSEMLLDPGPDMAPTDDLYTNCFTWIPGAPDHLLMFPTIWHRHDDTTTISFASSANGGNWHFIPGGRELVETGPFERWDGGCIWASPPLMEFGDGSFVLRLRGDNFPHKYPRGYRAVEEGIAIWPHGRIVALEAPEKGEFATVAVVPPGNKLFINARTKRSGSIRVAVKTGLRRSTFTMAHDWEKIGGTIIPGREFENSVPIIGDKPRVQVTWKNADNLGIKPGEPVVLLFKLEQAEIFWLEFE